MSASAEYRFWTLLFTSWTALFLAGVVVGLVVGGA